MTYDGKSRETLREGADHLTNEASTCEPRDTALTQRRSRGVRGRKLAKQLHKMVHGRIYFVRAADAIKIGFSTNSASRILALQTSNPETLALLGTMAGTERDEQGLHHRFRHLHRRGEWFTAGDDLIQYIETTTDEGIAAAAARAKAVPKRPKVRATDEVRGLIAARVVFGADTMKGIVCSTLVEQLGHFRTATGMQRANLAKLIPASMERLAG